MDLEQVSAQLLTPSGTSFNLIPHVHRSDETRSKSEPDPAPAANRVTELEALGPLLRQGQLDILFSRVAILNQSDPEQTYLTDAEAILTARLRQNPNTINDLYSLAVAQALQRHATEASQTLERIVTLDPGNPYAWIGLGVVELYRFRPNTSQAALAHAAKLLPEGPTTRTLKIAASAMRLDVPQLISLLYS